MELYLDRLLRRLGFYLAGVAENKNNKTKKQKHKRKNNIKKHNNTNKNKNNATKTHPYPQFGRTPVFEVVKNNCRYRRARAACGRSRAIVGGGL